MSPIKGIEQNFLDFNINGYIIFSLFKDNRTTLKNLVPLLWKLYQSENIISKC